MSFGIPHRTTGSDAAAGARAEMGADSVVFMARDRWWVVGNTYYQTLASALMCEWVNPIRWKLLWPNTWAVERWGPWLAVCDNEEVANEPIGFWTQRGAQRVCESLNEGQLSWTVRRRAT